MRTRVLLQEILDGIGAVVMGRKSFDKNEGDGGWGDGGPLGDTPCFVVTHNKQAASYPSVFTFVTDGVASAVEQAKHAAGDKVVGLHGATVMQQALPLGPVTLERTNALATPAATHLEFRVAR
jgi:dihydrofolate reductase